MIQIIEGGFKKISVKSAAEDTDESLSLDEIKSTYKSNFQRIKKSLSLQIITSADKKISFNFDFYNALLSDSNLM